MKPRDLYLLDDELYTVVSVCEHPTATLENVLTGQRVGGAIHSPNVTQFKPVEGLERDALMELLKRYAVSGDR